MLHMKLDIKDIKLGCFSSKIFTNGQILKVREVPLAALEFNIHSPPPAPPGSCNQPSATLPGD